MKINSLLIFFAVLFLIVFQFNPAHAGDKIKIHLQQPPPNKLGVSDLWKLDVTNTSNLNVTIYLEGSVSEEKDGLIVSGKSKEFVVKPGKTTYGYNDFKNGNVNWINNKYQEAIIRTGNIASGNYTICVTAFFENGTVADRENCVEQKIEITNQTQITLVLPSEEAELDPDTSGNINFVWIAIDKGPFDILLKEMKSTQTPEQAMKENRDFFKRNKISTTSFSYPLTAPKFEKGKKYVWIISVVNKTSEPRVFTISGSNKN